MAGRTQMLHHDVGTQKMKNSATAQSVVFEGPGLRLKLRLRLGLGGCVCWRACHASAEDGLDDPAERALHFLHAGVGRRRREHEPGGKVRAVVRDGLGGDLVGQVGAAADDDERCGEAVERD